MPTLKMRSILASLSSRRPVFHSEADFQHALAWELHLADPSANIRLEKQVALAGARVHLDLLVQSSTEELAIELKYKTCAAKIVRGDEEFSLRNHSAQDIGRHDFLKDIQRLETYVRARQTCKGYAILLTNDRTYWTECKRSDSVDSEFHVHEGRVLNGTATWGVKASAGTKHMREEPIALHGEYDVHWFDYSCLGGGVAEQFRYTVLRVASDAYRCV